MVDIAELGFKVDASGLRKGSDELKKLSNEAKRTAPAIMGAAKAMQSLAGVVKGLAISGTSSAIMGATKAMQFLANVVKGLAIGGAVAGIGVLVGSMRAFVSNTIEAEKVTRQLEAAVKSTGGAAGFTVKQLQAQATALQNITTFGDEAIMTMQSQLLTFTQVRGEIFKQAQMSVLDLATRMGGDIKGAVVQIGKALNDPILGASALSRSGVQFTDTQKDMIKQMVETNRLADAQKMILAELETQFGGSAIAARNTLGGALESLKNTWGDLFEVGSEASAGLQSAIEELISEINSPNFQAAVEAIGVSLFGALTVVAGSLPSLVDRLDSFLGKLGLIPARISEVSAQAAILVDQLRISGLAGQMPVTTQKYQNIAGAGLFLDSGAFNQNTALNQGGAMLPSVFSSVPKIGRTGGGGAAGTSYADIVKDAEKRIQTLQMEQQAVTMLESAAAKLRFEQELLNKAQDANIKLSPEQSAKLKELATTMAEVEQSTKGLEFSKDIFKGFVSDIMRGNSALEAMRNLVGKLADRLLEFGTNQLFSALGQGGGGGFLGGQGKILGFASGGYTGNGGRGQVAGVVHGQEYVVNAAATAKNRSTLEAMNRGEQVSGGGTVVNIINNTGQSVQQRQSKTPSGQELREIIIGTVQEATATGRFDGVNSSSYGLQPRGLAR